MEEEEKKGIINVYGIANIGCTIYQTMPTNNTSKPQTMESPSVPCKGGRPKKAGKRNMKSFIYTAHTESNGNLRLQGFYHALLQLKWIADDTPQKTFLSLFSGEETTSRVVWTGEINTLAELFKELVSRKQYVRLPKGESLWVMVNARFWDKKGNCEFGNNRLRSTNTPSGKKETIDLLVKVMNPDLPLEELRIILQSQR